MPIQSAVYTPFSEISISQNHAYLPQMQKSAACDRLINLIYDETLTHASDDVLAKRLQAITKYHGVKRSMEQAWYPYGAAPTRIFLREYTLNSAMVEMDTIPVGRGGRYDRALIQVINESTGHSDKLAAVQIWLNNVVTAIGQDFSRTETPLIADTSVYRVNAGPAQINTGATINLSTGDRIDMYTSGINFGSSQWQKDSVDIGSAVEESYRISSTDGTDDGEYENVYINQHGTTTSEAFNLEVT